MRVGALVADRGGGGGIARKAHQVRLRRIHGCRGSSSGIIGAAISEITRRARIVIDCGGRGIMAIFTKLRNVLRRSEFRRILTIQ